jgi:hypothetical protein
MTLSGRSGGALELAPVVEAREGYHLAGSLERERNV